jgi:hypothetical protein
VVSLLFLACNNESSSNLKLMKILKKLKKKCKHFLVVNFPFTNMYALPNFPIKFHNLFQDLYWVLNFRFHNCFKIHVGCCKKVLGTWLWWM